MESSKNKNLAFLIVFLVLTVLCWCPLGYGSYGKVAIWFGMPSWAFILLVIGTVLFVIEWIFLFNTDLALYDDNLDEIIDELKSVGLEQTKITEDI